MSNVCDLGTIHPCAPVHRSQDRAVNPEPRHPSKTMGSQSSPKSVSRGTETESADPRRCRASIQCAYPLQRSRAAGSRLCPRRPLARAVCFSEFSLNSGPGFEISKVRRSQNRSLPFRKACSPWAEQRMRHYSIAFQGFSFVAFCPFGLAFVLSSFTRIACKSIVTSAQVP